MQFLWIAALVLTAEVEPVIVVARQGDATSLAAPEALRLVQSKTFSMWIPSPQTVTDVALKMHVSPYILGDLQKLRDPANALFKNAVLTGQHENYREALGAALYLPPSNPSMRSNVILTAERAFASVLVSAKFSADSLMLDIGFRTGFALESFDKPEVATNYQLVVGRARGSHSAEVAVRMSVPFELSIDGTPFAPPPAKTRLAPGTHEIITRIGDRLGLIHTFDVLPGSSGAAQAVQVLQLQPEIERALLFTPDGFFLRAGEPFTASQAALLRNGSDAHRVWLVESVGDRPAQLRVTISDGVNKVAAVVPVRGAEVLRPRNEEQQKQLAEAIIAGARAAETAGTAPLEHYDVTRAANGDFALVSVNRVPLYDQWWLWTAVGAVVVAGTITAVVLATRDMNVTLISHVTSQ